MYRIIFRSQCAESAENYHFFCAQNFFPLSVQILYASSPQFLHTVFACADHSPNNRFTRNFFCALTVSESVHGICRLKLHFFCCQTFHLVCGQISKVSVRLSPCTEFLSCLCAESVGGAATVSARILQVLSVCGVWRLFFHRFYAQNIILSLGRICDTVQTLSLCTDFCPFSMRNLWVTALLIPHTECLASSVCGMSSLCAETENYEPTDSAHRMHI